MMNKLFVPAVLLAASCFLLGCGDSTSDDSAAQGPTPTVQAREPSAASVPDAAKIAELNRQLVAKMSFGTPDEVAALLRQGATPAAQDRYGLPVVFLGARRGDIAILEHLIKAGADVNRRIGTTYNDDGVGYGGTSDGTPLGYAAAAGHVGAMEVLKNAGANVNGAGLEGTSPLMQAAEAGQLQAVRWLVNNGSTQGKSEALSLAQRIINPNEAYRQIITLLR